MSSFGNPSPHPTQECNSASARAGAAPAPRHYRDLAPSPVAAVPFGTGEVGTRGAVGILVSRGPGPGYYGAPGQEGIAALATKQQSSSFKSKTTRLSRSIAVAPGPGAYESRSSRSSRTAPQAWALGPTRQVVHAHPVGGVSALLPVEATEPALSVCTELALAGQECAIAGSKRGHVREDAPTGRSPNFVVGHSRKSARESARSAAAATASSLDSEQQNLYVGNVCPSHFARKMVFVAHADVPMSAFSDVSPKLADINCSDVPGPGFYDDVSSCLSVSARNSKTPESRAPFGSSGGRFKTSAANPDVSPEIGPGTYDGYDDMGEMRATPRKSPPFGNYQKRWDHEYCDDRPGPGSYHRPRPASVASGCPYVKPDGVGFSTGVKRCGILGDIWAAQRHTGGNKAFLSEQRRLGKNVREALNRSPDGANEVSDDVGPGAYGAPKGYERPTARKQPSREGFLATVERWGSPKCRGNSPGPGYYTPRAVDTPTPTAFAFGEAPDRPHSVPPPPRPVSVPPDLEMAMCNRSVGRNWGQSEEFGGSRRI